MRDKVKKRNFLRSDVFHRVVCLRDDVDVIAAQDDEIDDLFQKVRRGLVRGMADDTVERGLHRAGRNFERLEEIGANANRDHDGDEDDFDVLAPMRFPRYRREPVQRLIQCLGCAVNSLAVSSA